jgi:hypothetical protein
MRKCDPYTALVAFWIGITRTPVSALRDPFPGVDLLDPEIDVAVAVLS